VCARSAQGEARGRDPAPPPPHAPVEFQLKYVRGRDGRLKQRVKRI
jgi:hypothetical protein